MSVAELVFWIAGGLLLYHLALYPLSLLALAAGRRAEPPALAEAELPTVSVVVAAHNEAAVIEARIANFLALDYPAERLELLIGSDASDDGTDELAARHAGERVRLFRLPVRGGKAAVLNELVPRARGEILVFTDADISFAPDALRWLVRPFREARVGCVSGGLRFRERGSDSGEGFYWRLESALKRAEGRLGVLAGGVGGIYAIRRPLFRPLPPETIVDDFVIAARILVEGHRVRYEERAVAWAETCETLEAELVRKVRIAAGNFQALTQVPALLNPLRGGAALAFWSHKVLRWHAPFLLAALLLASLALAAEPFYAAALAGQAAFYALALLGRSRKPAGRGPLARAARAAGYLLATHLALVEGLFRYLAGRQKGTWERVRPDASGRGRAGERVSG